LVCYRCNGTDHFADSRRVHVTSATVKDILYVQHVVLEDKRRNLNIEIREYMHSTMKKMMIFGFTVFIRTPWTFRNSIASFVAVSIATAISNALSSKSSLIVNSFF
jgi:hypothetical protein